MINQLFNNLLGLAEAGGNRVLSFDPQALRRCAEMQGNIIAIELVDVERTLYCHPGNWGLRISVQTPPREADAIIRARLMALANLAFSGDKLSSSMEQRIEISGHVSVAQKFQRLLQEIDIDWEEQLSKLLGDAVAFRIGQGVNHTRNWAQESARSFSEAGRDFLQNDSASLPSNSEFKRFNQQVTEMRNAVDRMEALLDHHFGRK